MNEKIKELIDRTDLYRYIQLEKTLPSKELEKFAELLIQEYAEELRQLNDGERVVLPKNREHAQVLVTVGMHYLEQNNVLSKEHFGVER